MQQFAPDIRPLCEFPSGAAVTITAIDGGAGARCRLCAMGLTPGSRVVVNSNGCGACSVRVRDTTVTLGRGLAGKVLACPATGAEPAPVAPPDLACVCKDLL
jgi:ferrous iron transport protein A